MKTGGEKHNNYKTDVDWYLITPPYGSHRKQQKALNTVKRLRMREYKKRARRLAKKFIEFFMKNPDDN